MSGELLGNIPRIHTALAEWLACMACMVQLPKRFRGPKLWAAAGGALVLMCAFLELTGGLPVGWFLPCIVASALMMLGLLALCCRIPLKNAAYCCVRAFITAEFAASLEWQLYSYYWYAAAGGKDTGVLVRCAFLLGTYFVVFGLLCLLDFRRRSSDAALQNAQLTAREMWSSIAIGAAIYGLSNLSYVTENTPFSGQGVYEIFNIRTLVDLGGIAILYAYHVQLSELHARREVDALQNVLHAQYTQYQQSQESIELINRKYHDLKHQIAVLRSEADTEKKNAYLDRIEEEIRAYEAQNKTGNQVLDTVLTSKSLYCQRHNISLTSVVDGTLLNFMDEMDLCTLFGNALDNAIESVEKVRDLEKRLIHLSVARQKAFVHIRLENTYAGELKFEGDLPVTTKADSRNHGYGLKSIRQTAKKYGGSATVAARGEWFELRVLIPLNGM